MSENAPETVSQKRRRWANTRRMAWLAMVAACIYPGLIVYSESSHLVQTAMPFYTFMGAVVGVYVGFSTWEEKWRR